MPSPVPNHHDRVPVAQPRPTPPRPAERRRPASGVADAGLTLIFVAAVFAAAGAWLGGKLDAAFAGGLVAGFAGIIAGFLAVYVRYRDL